MQGQTKRDHHAGLVLEMADRQGLDLEELTLRGALSDDDFEEAVDRCVGCSQPGTCKHLLDKETGAIDLPAFCRNQDLFKELVAS